MSTYQPVISPAAQDDLKDIYKFSLHSRGQSRSSKYLDTLKAQFWAFTLHPLLGAERKELLLHMRSFPLESHIIYYRVQSVRIEIVRVLHNRQDPNRQF